MNPQIKKITKSVYFWVGLVLALIFVYVIVLAFGGVINIPGEIILGSLHFRFYGLILLGSILVAAYVFTKLLENLAKKDKKLKKQLKKFDIYEMLIWIIIPGIVFARVFYYFSFINEYYGGSLSEIFKVWNGGLSIFGAVIGGILGLILYLKRMKISLFPLLDLIFIVLPLGHAFGRWANFLNQEIFGPPTKLPWKMFVRIENRPFKFIDKEFFHPLFLYEFILNLFTFGFLYYLFKKKVKRFNGYFISIYLILYGLIRLFIEFLRFDPVVYLNLSVAQFVSLGMILGGAIFLASRSGFFRNK